MSAFIVSHDHIDALLSFAKDKRMKDQFGHYIQESRYDQFTWTDIGRVLLAENERSVCELYPDVTPGNAPGTTGEEAIGYTFRYFEEFHAMAHLKKMLWVIQGCNCFDYQACETADYNQTITHRIIEAIRSKAIHCLPGMDEAPWEINRGRQKVV